jgi:putative phosphonate catabolism associated alcohol dehydrogenase
MSDKPFQTSSAGPVPAAPVRLSPLPSSALAAVFHAPQQALELRQVPLPKNLSVGEALVEISCCTLCGSDLSTLAGHRQEPTPCILGHEILGRIVALGAGELVDLRGRPLRVGDRVIWSVAASCSQCRNCNRGLPQKCSQLKKYGHSQLTEAWQLSGGLAQYCHLVAGTQTVIVGEMLADRILTPASCATATVAAAVRKAGNLKDTHVLVFGAGLLGLTACAMAKQAGAQSITICDLSSERIALAQKFGASRGLLWQEWDQPREPAYDVILEMSGNAAAIQAALQVAAIGATIVLVGSVRPTPAIELYPEQFVRRLLSMHGVHNYSPADLLTAVDFLENWGLAFPFGEVVTEPYPLSDINALLSSDAQRHAVRIAVAPR